MIDCGDCRDDEDNFSSRLTTDCGNVTVFSMMPSKASYAVDFTPNRTEKNYGHPATLLEVAVAHLSLLFGTTSNSSKLHTKTQFKGMDVFTVRALDTAKGQCLPRYRSTAPTKF
jgi:hypothetical protein